MENKPLRMYLVKDSLGGSHRIMAEQCTWTEKSVPVFFAENRVIAYFTQPIFVKEIKTKE